MPFFWKKKIRSLAGLIALSPDQSAYLRSVCGTETRVALIPHGIDTSLYAPRDDLRSSELLLSVGNHLRDFTTVLKAMQILANVAPTLKLVVISTPAVSCFSGIQNIISIENISDEDLINYYRRASFAVLPFDALVASNAMLEGMAFGMPIVCPDSDAARYYLGADIQTMYKPADPKSLVEKILWLHRNDRERRFLCSAMRERAEQFAWSKVCEQIIAFYEEILDQHDEIAS
jgi:glycosyltransferase involved in cell wall biosynthesis